MPSDFLTRLQQAPVLADGAMGTELYARGIFINRCYDELNLTNPDIVAEVRDNALIVPEATLLYKGNDVFVEVVARGQHGIEGVQPRSVAVGGDITQDLVDLCRAALMIDWPSLLISRRDGTRILKELMASVVATAPPPASSARRISSC